MRKVKIGIIGCGGIANNKHFPSLKKNSELNEIVAFCDIIEERAAKAAKEFGTPDAKVYVDEITLKDGATHVTTDVYVALIDDVGGEG